jgi:hypothetical protein
VIIVLAMYPSYQPTFPGSTQRIMFAVDENKMNCYHEKQTRDVPRGKAMAGEYVAQTRFL